MERATKFPTDEGQTDTLVLFVFDLLYVDDANIAALLSTPR
jgi:hypothetical protein